MKRPWSFSSIASKTTLCVLAVALGIGFIASEIAARFAQRFELGRAKVRVAGLLAVVEPWSSAACFVGDPALAEEAAQGLLNSPSIACVEVRDADAHLLAQVRRPSRSSLALYIVRPVPSPFRKEQMVGEIRAFLDGDEIARNVVPFVWTVRWVVLLMASVVGGVLALTVMHIVVRPIQLLSDRLDDLEASHETRLACPPGHEKDEIGRLAGNINKALEGREERHLLAQEVMQAQKLSSLGSLAGGVAHDFNNMLSGITAYTDLLLMEIEEPRHRHYLQNILSASSRSAALTAKLLAFGRRGKNLVEAVDLGGAVQECLSMVKPSMAPDLRVTCCLEDKVQVDGDPSQIHQILLNLCINAVEAMKGKGDLMISTRLVDLDEAQATACRLTSGRYAQLKVADTGPGISKEVLSRIFEPFFTTKNKQGEMGTGLGLSTVYGIVAAHRGMVEVTSTPALGTTFEVLLPQGRLATPQPVQEGAFKQGDGLILVVDDETIPREVASTSLESLGFTVATARNGQEGVALFQELHPQLRAVLLDLKMPVMDGGAAFVQMHGLDAAVPIILCSGYGENEELQDLLNRGAASLLHKPYRILDLAKAIQQASAGPLQEDPCV